MASELAKLPTLIHPLLLCQRNISKNTNLTRQPVTYKIKVRKPFLIWPLTYFSSFISSPWQHFTATLGFLELIKTIGSHYSVFFTTSSFSPKFSTLMIPLSVFLSSTWLCFLRGIRTKLKNI